MSDAAQDAVEEFARAWLEAARGLSLPVSLELQPVTKERYNRIRFVAIKRMN